MIGNRKYFIFIFFQVWFWMVRGGVCTYIGCTMMGHEAFIALLHGWGVFWANFFLSFKDPTHFGKPQFFHFFLNLMFTKGG